MTDPSLPFAKASRPDADASDLAFTAWKAAPTPQTRAALLTAMAPTLDTAVNQYAGGPPSPTLRSRAKIMALQAMERFDPQRGKLHTHVLSQLQGLRRVAGGEAAGVVTPERVVLNRVALTRAEQELEDKFGRAPTTTELAGHTGLSPRRLAYIRRAHVPLNSGAVLDADGNVFNPASDLPGDNPAGTAWQEFIHRDLDPTNQLIMEHTMGMFGRRRLSTGQLAVRLGVTPGAISQRKAKIHTMLQSGDSSGLF